MADKNRDVLIRIDQAPKPFPVDLETGQPEPVFAVVAELWAQRRPYGGQEAFAAQQPVAKADVIFNVRDPWPSLTITPDEAFRIIDLSDDAKEYDVTRVDKVGPRRAELDVYAFARAEAA